MKFASFLSAVTNALKQAPTEPQNLAPPENPMSFKEFVEQSDKRYKWYKHCEVLADVLQRVADGELKRVMVFMPPRHGKSQLSTKLFPAYYLYRHPDRWVGLTSYSADLSYTFSRAVRDFFIGIGGVLRRDSRGVKHWGTLLGGGAWAAGVGGPATGKGFHCGIVDDPLKNAVEAFSDKIRSKHKDWWGSTWYTRCEPGGAMIVIQTRWHEDDLSGWLLSCEGIDDEPENWHIVNFEAIKGEKETKFPPNCTVEPDWRQPGEALCPERYSLKTLLKTAKRLGTYFWSAMFQQSPAPKEGGLFKRRYWKRWDYLPISFDIVIISVDAAFKSNKDSDYVVVQVWGRKGSNFYLIDSARGKMGITATENQIFSMKNKYPDTSGILIEDKANGSAIVERISRVVPGVIAVNPGKDSKISRAIALVPLAEAGNIWLPPGVDWADDYIDEFADFPNGKYDDQVDGTSQAIKYLAQETYDITWLDRL